MTTTPSPTDTGRQIMVSFPAEMPISKADFVLLEQAVANLLDNAALHTLARIPITIDTCVSRRVSIAVAKRGPGIEPGWPPRSTQKLKRAYRTCPDRPGLSIMQGLVLAQSGQAVAKDNPADRSRFTRHPQGESHETAPLE